MNILWPLLLAVLVFVPAFMGYGKYLARVFGENPGAVTPAVAQRDDVDYAPTRTGVVFSHHFAAIAGAGPIVGPTVAMIYGYLPVWLWVVLGAVFFGAMMDYATLFMSLRERGRSVAQVAHGTLGRLGFILFISFTLVMLLLVTSAFLGLTTVSLTSLVPLAALKIADGQTFLRTVTGANGQVSAQIGGIASTSVILLTLTAPIIGWLLYRRKAPVRWVSLLALGIGTVSIGVGIRFPVTLPPTVWMVLLTAYVFLAAGVPVWLVLQPRDFINSFVLYLGIAALCVGGLGGGLQGVHMHVPAWQPEAGVQGIGAVWPFLFITVACGAISGFHSLVTGGTVSKQLTSEPHARTVGYGGMLLEALLAVGVIVTLGGGLDFQTYRDIVHPAPGGLPGNPILAFSLAMGRLLNQTVSLPVSMGTVFGILMVEGFVITTLDAAVRINRMLFEELWTVLFKSPPRWLRSYAFNAGLSALLMLVLCYTNSFKLIWPIFGAANQLLASLSLIVVSAWLAARGKPNFFAVLPAAFMIATTTTGLWRLLVTQYWPARNWALSAADLLLLALSAGVVCLVFRRFRTGKTPVRA